MPSTALPPRDPRHERARLALASGAPAQRFLGIVCGLCAGLFLLAAVVTLYGATTSRLPTLAVPVGGVMAGLGLATAAFAGALLRAAHAAEVPGDLTIALAHQRSAWEYAAWAAAASVTLQVASIPLTLAVDLFTGQIQNLKFEAEDDYYYDDD